MLGFWKLLIRYYRERDVFFVGSCCLIDSSPHFEMSYAGIPGWQRQRPCRCVEGCRTGATGLSSGWWQVHGSHLVLKVEQQGKNIAKNRSARVFFEANDDLFSEKISCSMCPLSRSNIVWQVLCVFLFSLFFLAENLQVGLVFEARTLLAIAALRMERRSFNGTGEIRWFFSKEESKFGGEIWDFFSGVFQGITF